MIRNIEIESLLESEDLELKDQSGLDRWSVSFEATLTKSMSLTGCGMWICALY